MSLMRPHFACCVSRLVSGSGCTGDTTMGFLTRLPPEGSKRLGRRCNLHAGELSPAIAQGHEQDVDLSGFGVSGGPWPCDIVAVARGHAGLGGALG